VTLKILIVSDRADYRQLLAHHVTLEWPDALPAEYEPATRGRLQPTFTGAAYDAILLDQQVQEGRGAEWARRPCRTPRLPADRLFRRCARRAVRAAGAHLGASHVLARANSSTPHLVALLRAATARRHNVLAEASRAAREPPARDRFGSVRIRGYHCLRRLAVGGSASVFLAEYERDGSQRVLKIFRQVPDVVEGSSTFDRFLREYELVAHLRHPEHRPYLRHRRRGRSPVPRDGIFPGGDLRSRMREPLQWRVALAYCGS